MQLSPKQQLPVHVWFAVRQATHEPLEHICPVPQRQSLAHVEHVSVPLHVPSPQRGTALHTGFEEGPQL